MTHNNHTDSDSHKELDSLGREKLLALVDGWSDPLRIPSLEEHKISRGRTIIVVRDDKMGFGTKIRAGSAALFQPEYKKQKTIVYVAPRVGWAPLSLAKLCSETKRRLILFCPASKVPSEHQLVAKALGAELRFCRVAAMPNLQSLAKSFAATHGYTFFPLGLDVPAAVAGIAARARDVSDVNGIRPSEVWSVMSTGVLSRGLQVAWPKARFYGVAVARNMKEGEKGKATVISHPLAFLERAWVMPPFPSVPTYDAKAWQFIEEYASDKAWFWNVAGAIPAKPASSDGVNSNLAWYDMSAFDKP